MIPKFRAWDKELQCWCPYRIYSLNELGDDVVEFMYVAHKVWFTNKESGNNFILMQSTGLEDKNGVEIFEGDEIELTHSDLEGETIYSKAIAKAPMDYTLEEAVALNHAHEIELTGKNIYENPELLEVAE